MQSQSRAIGPKLNSRHEVSTVRGSGWANTLVALFPSPASQPTVMPPNSEFLRALDRTVKPKLESLGFKKMIFKNCIQPEFLFNKGQLWFGASFDRRDRYLSVELGRLYWFSDVMPRVIVLGDYGDYCPGIKSISLDNEEGFTALASEIRDTLGEAIEIYSDRYDQILAARKNPKALKYRREFFLHLGDEVSIDDVTRLATAIGGMKDESKKG